MLEEFESTYTYRKAGIIALCKLNWLLSHRARNCGTSHASFHFIGATNVHYANGGLKGSIAAPLLNI